MNSQKISYRPQDYNMLRAFTFSIFTISSVVATFFPLYFAEIGFTNVQIGFIYSLGPLISLFSNLLWGIASDRFRTLKKILILLLIGQLIMISILTQTTSFALVCIVVLLFNFFFFPIYPLSDTMAIMTMQERGRNFMVVRIFGSLGFAASALILGMLLKQTGSHVTMWVCLSLTIISLLWAFTLTDKQGSVKKMEFSGLWKVLRQREVVWFFIFVFALAIAHRFNDAFLSLVLREMHANESTIGWSLTASSLSEIPVFFLLAKYGNKFKELPLLALASFMYAIRFLLMSIVSDPNLVIGIQAMHSVSFGIYFFTAVRYITNVIPDEYRATGLALFTIVWSSIAGLISGAFGGQLLNQGKAIFYLIAMALSFLACLGFLSRHLFAKERV